MLKIKRLLLVFSAFFSVSNDEKGKKF